MTKYLVLYRRVLDAPDPMLQTNPELMAAGKKAWGDWLASVGDALIDFGSPTNPVTPITGRDKVSGFTILEAPSPEALADMLATHPHKWEGSFEVHAFAGPPAG